MDKKQEPLPFFICVMAPSYFALRDSFYSRRPEITANFIAARFLDQSS
jgi:hypothetical protein